MEIHKDQKYIEALINANKQLIKEIYEKFTERVINFVKRNSGDVEDAKDLFQESLIDLHNMALNGFVLDRPFSVYFMGICRYKWMDVLNARKKTKEKKQEYLQVTISLKKRLATEVPSEVQLAIAEYKQYQLFIEKFRALPNHCQEIIGLGWIHNELTGKINSLKDIAKMLDRNYAYIRREKGACVKKLITSILEDNLIKKI